MRAFIVRWLSLVPVGKNARTRTSAKKPPAHRPAAERGDYRAVELRTHGPACRAARALAGKRVLIAEAPPLPLPNCAQSRCSCYYKHHADRRRDEPRRRADVGVSGTFYSGPERRSGLDRRQSHRAAADDDYYDYMRRR